MNNCDSESATETATDCGSVGSEIEKSEKPSLNGDNGMDIDEQPNEAEVKTGADATMEVAPAVAVDENSPKDKDKTNTEKREASPSRKRKLDDRDDLSDGSNSSDFLGFPDIRTEEKKKQQEKPKLDLLVFDSAFGKGKRSRIPNRKYESLINIKAVKQSRYDDFDEVTSSEDGRNEDDPDMQKNDDEVSSSAQSSPMHGSRSKKGSVITPARGKQKRVSTDMSNPKLKRPFELGWKRELVYRSTVDKNQQRNGDVYYYTPNGKKIRSMRELAENLHLNPELTMEHFSFWRGPVGINDPEQEIIRDAKMKTSVTPVAKKGTPKKVVKEKPEPSPKPAPTESPPSKPITRSPRLGGFKVKIPAPARLTQSAAKNEKKKAQNQSDSEMEIGMLPPAWSPKKGAAGKGTNWQNKAGSGLGDPSLDTNKPFRPCSIRCLGVTGLIPTLQCRLCLCLYHKECVGEASDDIPAGYICKNCQLETQGTVDAPQFVPEAPPPPPLTPISALKANPSISIIPPQLQRIPRPNDSGVVDNVLSSIPVEPDVFANSTNPVTVNFPPIVPAPALEIRKNIVGAVTTWFAPNSRVRMNSKGVNLKDTANCPKPQSVAYMGDRKFLVLPKGNVLSVSPTAGAALSTPTVFQQPVHPTADQAPVLVPPGSNNVIIPTPGTEIPPSGASLGPETLLQVGQPPQLPFFIRDVLGSLPVGENIKENQATESPSKSKKIATRKSVAVSSSTTKTDTESRFMQNYLQNLSYGYQTLLYVFQYLKVQDLLRAGCVCTLWRDIASHPTLWKTVRMKNSQVSDWEGLADALKKHNTVNLDLRKMLLPNQGDDMWELFSKAIARVDNLVRIELCRCPSMVIENLAKNNKNLQVINAVTIRCEILDISNVNNLENLQELRLKSTNGFCFTSDLTPLKKLTNLKHLSLTSVKDLHNQSVTIIGELVNLETLDLGECNDFPENFGTDVISKLIKLEKLRLEKGQGTCCTFNILDAVSQIQSLEQLELVNFDVKVGFDKALGSCFNLKKLLIIPTYISQSATTNHMVLGGVIKLKSTLSHFVWGVTLELLRVTELFVDQCEDTPGKEKKKPSGSGDSIPVLKPVPFMHEDAKEDAVQMEPPQVEILPLPTLQKLLLNCLPSTRVKILKIPFHATWRQSIVDTVN